MSVSNADLNTFGDAITAYDSATGADLSTADPWDDPRWGSGIGNPVVGSAANFNQWAAPQNGGQIPIYGPTPNAQSTLVNPAQSNAATANAAMSPQVITPATIASQFPGGIPQSTPSGVSAQAVDPSMSIAATEAYLQPQFAQQQSALTANLANAGIVGGTAPQAAAQLGQQQQTTLQNNIQPFLQQGALANQSTALQGSEYNATAQSQSQQFNIQNLLQTGQIDAATYNQMMQTVMASQNQDWLAQLSAQTSVAQGNQSSNNQAFNPIYQQPSSTNLSGFGSAAGSAFQVPAAQQPTTAPATTNTSGDWLS